MIASPFHSRFALIALSLAGVIVIGSLFVAPQGSRAQVPATAPSTGVAALHQQRVEALQQAAAYVRPGYEQGMTTAAEIHRVDRMLLDAQLEAATTDAQRVKLLQKALEMAKKQEEVAAARHAAGQATSLVPLEAKADRLRVEIKLAEMTAK